MHLFFCDELPAPMGDAQPLVSKKETTPSPRAVRRSATSHRTGYEEAGGPTEIQRQLGIKISDRPIGQKEGVRGLPGAFLVTFCAYKKLPGSGAGSPGS